jgi:Ca-activated chloride channel homolog
MSRTLLAVALAAALVAQQTQTPVYRVTGELVPVFATVVDKSERLVTTLAQEDFQVLDNGKPQPIVVFDNSPAPIRLIVLLDVSGSRKGNLPLLKAASHQLFTKLGPADAARVGFFGNEITISPVFTNEPAKLMAAMPEEIENAPTPLWEAVDTAITELKGVEQRRVVLVLSDGADSGYRPGKKFYNQLDIVERARQEDVMIYGVGMRPRLVNSMDLKSMLDSSEPDPNLGKVALETGGGYIALRGNDDLNAAFTRVADELHSQYRLGFVPPARDGKTHKIEVKMKNPDLKSRARKTYVAPKGAS